MRAPKRHAQFLLLSLIFFPVTAQAGAWLQPKKHGQIIISDSYAYAGKYFDNEGHRHSQPNYFKYEFSPYIEYGVRDYLTLGATVSLQRAYQRLSPGNIFLHYGVGDSEFFARTRIFQDKNFILSATGLIKAPSPQASTSYPRIGSITPDVGGGLSAGYAFDAFGRHHFASVDTLYRSRLGSPRNQVNVNATVGIGITKKWMFMPQLFVTRRTSHPDVVVFNQSPDDDYDLNKVQLSAVYRHTSKISFQMGVFSGVTGKNTGKLNGAMLSMWKSF